jgi:hypothetical protein
MVPAQKSRPYLKINVNTDTEVDTSFFSRTVVLKKDVTRTIPMMDVNPR